MPQTVAKVLCRTPTPGKKPTRIDEWKFDLLARAIRKVVPKRGPGVLFSELTGLVENQLSPADIKRVGVLMWYVTTVKLEMEVAGELRRVEGSSPQRLLRT